MAFAKSLYLPLPVGSSQCQLLDNVTLHLLLIIRPTATTLHLSADFFLQLGELSTCQLLTARFLPACSVPLGPDSHALILLAYLLSDIELGLGS